MGADYIKVNGQLFPIGGGGGTSGVSSVNGRTGAVTLSKADVDLNNVPNVTTDNQTPTVTEASTRTNIASGDTLKTIIGKIKKFFTDLKTVAFTGSYNDLSDTPTIPTVGNGTLTIQRNGTTLKSFSANQSGDDTVNITVPTTTSELTNNSNFVSDANYVHTDNNFTNTYKNSIDSLKDLAFIATDNTPSDMPKYLKSDGTWQEFPMASIYTYGYMSRWDFQKLGTIQQGAEVNVQSDWDVTDTTSDAFIKNKPTSLPASDVYAWAKAATKPTYTSSEVGLGNVPNVATNDQTPTFTQASSRANIASGEKLSVILGKIMKWFADLKTVAFTGSYTNLTNRPTIGDGTLTIQKNGTTIDTFTANATGNKTVNVTVPTQLSQLTSDSTHRTVTDEQIATFSGNATWGGITGSLSNQTDLSSALNGKLDKAGGKVGPLTVEEEWSSGEIQSATLQHDGIRLYYSGGPFQSAYTVYLGGETLWTNPSVTADFAQQTVTLARELSDYEFYSVVCRRTKGNPQYLSTGLIPVISAEGVGTVGRLYNSAECNYMRQFNTNNDTGTSFKISTCGKFATYGSSNQTTANNYLIPWKIIGFRFSND